MKTTKKEQEISFRLGCLLNQLGVKSWDFSNDANNLKIKSVEKQILELVKTLPKL
jgi:hypothetical protein